MRRGQRTFLIATLAFVILVIGKNLTSSSPKNNELIMPPEPRQLTVNADKLSFLGMGDVSTAFYNMTIGQAQARIHRKLTNTTYKCERLKRYGHKGDGGYDVCLDPPFIPQKNNCLVYSFGIRNDWSFDEAINDEFLCEVHSFDPSINKSDHLHRPNMYFHNLGIWGHNLRNSQGWELRDLATIMADLGHTHRTVDYLKLDVEGAEWPVVSHLLTSGIHTRIRQMALEYHTPKLRPLQMTSADHGEVFSSLQGLDSAGFREFLHHTDNVCCGRFAMFTQKNSERRKNLCCYEVFYVNKITT